ncbi:MAG: hypothetical protein ACNS62_23560 [Candidatus Cyclobacteriaceae bacterium M3_2C_046]
MKSSNSIKVDDIYLSPFDRWVAKQQQLKQAEETNNDHSPDKNKKPK